MNKAAVINSFSHISYEQSINLLERIKGGLFGLAAGDALGATLEFMNRDEIQRKYGVLKDIIGEGWLGLQPGECTDDTAMTLAVAMGIQDNPGNPHRAVGQHFVSWYDTKPRDIGNIVSTSIYNFKKYDSWAEASQKTHVSLSNRSAGNGSLMRTLPVSLAYRHDKDKMCRISAQISHMTHYDSQAAAACIFYNLLVLSALEGNPDKDSMIFTALAEAKAYCSANLPALPKGYWEDIANSISLRKNQIWASGFVLDSLIAALWVFYHFPDFESTVIEAVNLGDDADTVGAICGGLAGCFYGYESIPGRWLEKLKVKDTIEKTARGLLDLNV
ncbi:ADP-ribosyl-(dinitrogen reductase) hydrolase [Desulfofarcimen acetoxidans DSM 771]|uniref:ADP-ribosyl-(Dinitrogen reductase) hydrolase n=1 Tax=Desulfofarcimen acetoxidans (strain ATCC 49208 / DSM 771 / KCTC 5769 / VKM B-1644 / 5575) TaxID=485916 RepID=C8VVZ0_DESAS|nr:ADP-ribosylglycohydrolase family protein [Desulfofarcimen acetoxidans]ACV64277.1 ADP-ribosyl-(dinitrogen reductase) hydrolase [Desulfofarcimen acetoxidans DSM 771]